MGLAVSVSVTAQAQSDSPIMGADPGDQLQFYHLVISPGMTSTTMFGHNALRVRDTHSGRDVVYNWGAMEAGEVRNLSDLFVGRLDATLITSEWRATVERYVEEDRTIVLQILDLPRDTAAALARALSDAALGENRTYRYDIIDNNCATRLRDLLDLALEGQLRRHATGPSPIGTMRDHLHRTTGSSPLDDLILSLVAAKLNKRIDQSAPRRYDALFLPHDIGELLIEIELRHDDGALRSMVSGEVVLHEQQGTENRVHSWWWMGCSLMVLTGGLSLFGGSLARGCTGAGIILWGLLAGVIGSALMIVTWWGLPSGWLDPNLAYFSPFHLILIPLGWQLGRGRTIAPGSVGLGAVLALTTSAAGLRVVSVAAATGNLDELGICVTITGAGALLSWWVSRRAAQSAASVNRVG